MRFRKKIFPVLFLLAGLTGILALCRFFNKPYGLLNWYICIYFYACLLCVILGFLAFIFNVFEPARETQYKILMPVMSVLLVLLGAEFYLRAHDINKAYIEFRDNEYHSAYIRKSNNVDWHYLPQSNGFLVAPEYNFPRHHNNFGFSDADFVARHDTNGILIQTYGDSFTEGDGAAPDSSYPAILRSLLKRDGYNNITVQNFGICGNDPAFCWRQLKDIGVGLKPDIIIIEYNGGDLTTDFFVRGGQERFHGDYFKGFDAPWWEMIYGVSYVARLVAHSAFHINYENFFLSDARAKQRIESLKPAWNHTFADIADIARKNNIKVLLIKKPEALETSTYRKYGMDFSFFDKMKDTIPCFRQYDLLPFFLDSFHINNDNAYDYWWRKDGHNKGKGYAMMAEGVYTGLKQAYPEIFTTLDTTKAAR